MANNNNHITTRIKHIFYILAVSSLVISFASAKTPKPTVGYFQKDGLKMYYEIHGTGKPILLLHGAFMSINSTFNEIIPGLAKTRKVICVELQGHGRTNDIDRPYSMANFADDVIGLLDQLKIEKTDILGYSMGGGVGIQIVARRPNLVDRMAIVSAPIKFEGWSEETRAVFPMVTPQMFEPTPIKSEYDRLAPDPKHWGTWISRMVGFITTPYDFTPIVKAIQSPILVILGDVDGIDPKHAAEIHQILVGGVNGDMRGPQKNQFAIFPGTPHTGVIMQTEWVLSMVIPFIDGTSKTPHMQVK
jgi:pimeloyl-ACP methyl ester carboxylesterase